MHLVAHSLSAFFAVGYAEKYPQVFMMCLCVYLWCTNVV